ncbi:MAG: hypothetical protein EOO63_15120 [Hymenobacter sp.]|nr:MAG: hypothetical protein EOO63_15120 [Hymenobacter sp.]
MKTGCLFLLSLLFTLPAFSQGRDTILAVHHLFKQKRVSGDAWATAGASAAVEESVGWRAIRSTSENVTAAVVYGGVPLVAGILQAQRFSVERERYILQQYAQGAPIPLDIRRKLRRKHFRRTARDIANPSCEVAWP